MHSQNTYTQHYFLISSVTFFYHLCCCSADFQACKFGRISRMLNFNNLLCVTNPSLPGSGQTSSVQFRRALPPTWMHGSCYASASSEFCCSGLEACSAWQALHSSSRNVMNVLLLPSCFFLLLLLAGGAFAAAKAAAMSVLQCAKTRVLAHRSLEKK